MSDDPARRRPAPPARRLVPLALLAGVALAAACSDSSSSGPPVTGTETTFSERQRDYLEFAAADPAPGGFHRELARLAVGAPAVDEQPFLDAIAKAREQKDTADFALVQLIRLLYLFEDRLSPATVADLDDMLLGFRYWFDEPGTGKVSLSENHQILYAAGEYLAGQRFRDRVFPGSGLTGQRHVEKARERILRWCRDRARFGYSEWLSSTYSAISSPGMLALIDFAEDPEVRDAATVAYDLLTLDMALNSFQGYLGAPRGRVPGTSALFDLQSATVATSHRILFEQGSYRGTNEWAGTCLATSTYEPPPVIGEIAREPRTMLNRQRNSVEVSEGPSIGYGYDTDDIVSAAFWYGMGAWTHPDVLPLTRALLVDHRQFPIDLEPGAIDDLIELVRPIPDALLRAGGEALAPILSGSMYDRVDILTYRAPEAMLASAQDDMKGTVGFQQHAWQATLGREAVVFTTHPGPLDDDSSIGGTYWNGGSSMPRVGQHDTAALILYDAEVRRLFGGLLAPAFPDLTHAYFPRAEFDEVVDAGPWTLARKGDGYVALYSEVPATWTTEGELADRELVAPGSRNAWICEIGSAARNGSFEEFVAAVTGAAVSVDLAEGAVRVAYDSPGQGPMELGWEGPMRVGDREIALADHPRYLNPYTDTAWDAEEMIVERGRARLHLDLVNLTRVE